VAGMMCVDLEVLLPLLIYFRGYGLHGKSPSRLLYKRSNQFTTVFGLNMPSLCSRPSPSGCWSGPLSRYPGVYLHHTSIII
jgi:hypothetical protein